VVEVPSEYWKKEKGKLGVLLIFYGRSAIRELLKTEHVSSATSPSYSGWNSFTAFIPTAD
jgi:hypothetical protein